MISKKSWLWIMVLIVIISTIGWTVYAQNAKSSNPTKATWEYKVVYKYLSEQDLNELGTQGWELVQYDPGVRGGGGSTGESFFFKRAR